MAVVYLLLSFGAATTLFPFILMVTTGFKGPTDQTDGKVLPAYWSEDDELLKKYRDDKFAGDASLLAAYEIGKDQGRTTVDRYRKFLETLPSEYWITGFKTPSNQVTSRLTLAWQQFLHKKYGSVDAINQAYGEINGAIQLVTVTPENLMDPTWQPKGDQKWKDWSEFKSQLPAEFRIPITERRLWQEFLRTKYKNQIDAVPTAISKGAKSFETIPGYPLMMSVESANELRPDWSEFQATGIPIALKDKPMVEELWRNSGGKQEIPVLSDESAFVKVNASTIRKEFTWRNYHYVFDYIVINGRALLNTMIFCGLAILLQLTVNPLAAYALSRYPMPATGKILLFLLATMAFPAEVTMIPGFLLLKDLGLLNTFAALVLPAAASGYMIFLLKGFFDSLPQEVFDSGQIDGAPEWVMMLKLAFPLSKPVFGYLALLAFMGAYGAFLFAFLVAQDRSMWTLTVFIYQLQQMAPKPVIMAATTLAAIPTVLVFLGAQNVIMKGIVLPGER